jgi:hypothetical protein
MNRLTRYHENLRRKDNKEQREDITNQHVCMHYPLTHVAACMICRRIVWNIFVIETHVTFFGKLDPLFSLSLFVMSVTIFTVMLQ